ncbi:MAG: MbnP family protein [Saprospiraceae bacterium]
MKQLIKFSTVLLLTTTVLFFSSCDSDEDISSSLDFHFHPKVGAEDFSFSKVFDINGVATQFATAQFYVHGIELELEDETKSFENHLLVKASQMVYSLGEVAKGTIKGIKFNVGVDSINNGQTEANFTSRTSDDPLSIQSPKMHWNWNMGYIFVKLEGMFDNDGDGTPDTPFEYHVGMNSMLRNIDLTANKAIMGDNMELMINVDYAQFFDGIDLKTNPTTHGMNAIFMDNIQSAFTVM